MPENDLFQIFEQVEPGSFFYDKTYPAGKEHRSADFMMIVINCLSLEPAKQRAFFQHLVANLEKAPGVRPADVLIRGCKPKPPKSHHGCLVRVGGVSLARNS